MQKYDYKVKTEDGETLKGLIEAKDEKSAALILRKRGMLVVSLKTHKKGLEIPFLSERLKRVRFDDVVNFTRQLSTMITAGLAITDALSILEVQSSTAMAEVIGEILQDVQGGSSLGAALKKHQRVFSSVYISLVEVGETAGVLDTVLKRLARNMEKQREFRSKIKGAMVYPAIVIFGMGVVAMVMMVFVIPKLTNMYRDFGAELPGATKVLIGTAEFTGKIWYVVLLLLAGAAVAFRLWIKTPQGRMQFDKFLLELPIIGPLKIQVIMTEFTRTMSLLVASGISVLEALSIVQGGLGSAVFEKSLQRAASTVEKGFPMAASLAQDPHFPPIVPQMVSVGEETGKLDDVLKKLSRYFEMEAAEKIKALTTAIEPLIMVLLGVGVGFLVIAVILPIYNLTSQF